MITEIQIENYKSIKRLKLSLGRVNVFIGENGCGKSNILEAIALSSAAANDKLDNEFLASRGIRVTDPELMRSAFYGSDMKREIKMYIEDSNGEFFSCILHHDNSPYSKWIDKAGGKIILEKLALLDSQQKGLNNASIQISVDNLRALMTKRLEAINFHDFLIYSPENSSLHTFETSGQIEPIGINGEGLFKLLKVLDSSENQEKINQLKDELQFIDWFDDFEIPHNVSMGERYIRVKDRYLDESSVYFDQRSSNEGFLFLLFYLALFISDGTPKFFGIDNIDASLNPKLCRGLVVKIVELARQYDKQVILTTHNPAMLDGLNLDDDQQRLFVISRNDFGHTVAERYLKPKSAVGKKSVRLSEAFLRGYLGGLPKNF